MSCGKLTIVLLIITALIVASFCEPPSSKIRRKHKKWKLKSLSSHTSMKQSGLANIVKNKTSGGNISSGKRSFGHWVNPPRASPVQKKGVIFKAGGPKAKIGLRKKFRGTRKRSKFIRSNMNRPRTRSLKMIHESLPVQNKGAALKDVGTKGNPRFYKNPTRKSKAKLSEAHWSKKSTRKLIRKKGQHLKNGVTGKSSNSKRKTRSRRKKSKILSQKNGRRGSKVSSTRNRARKTDRKNSRLSNLKVKASNSSIPNFVSLEGVKPPERVKDTLRKTIRKRKRLGKGKNSKTGTALNSPTNLKRDKKTSLENSAITKVKAENKSADLKSQSIGKPASGKLSKVKKGPIGKKPGKAKLGQKVKGKRLRPRRKHKKLKNGNDVMQGDQPVENATNETVVETPEDGSGSVDGSGEDVGSGDDGSGEDGSGDTNQPDYSMEPDDDYDSAVITNNLRCKFNSGPLKGKCMDKDEAIELLGKSTPQQMISFFDGNKAKTIAWNWWNKVQRKPIAEVLQNDVSPALGAFGDSNDFSMKNAVDVAGKLFTERGGICETIQRSIMVQDVYFTSIAYSCE